MLVCFTLSTTALTLTLFRYCGQDEDNDPGEEFEEALDCALCGQYGMSLITHIAVSF